MTHRRWEYLGLKTGDARLDLPALGAEGWELCGILEAATDTDGTFPAPLFYFKRLLSEMRPPIGVVRVPAKKSPGSPPTQETAT